MNEMPFVSLFAPSSKSLSHRTMIAASLASGVSHVQRVLESDDLERTIEIMRLCGAGIERKGPGDFVITGMGGSPGWSHPLGTPDIPLSCFVGESGTTCRLLAAVLAAGKGSFRIHGAGRMHQRPMRDIFAALTALGAFIHCEEKPDHAPCIITTSGLSMEPVAGGWLSVGCDESSQYLSGLLLAAPVTEKGLCIELGGSKTVSWPYVGLTFQILETFGVPFTVTSRGKAPGKSEGHVWTHINWREIRRAVPHEVRFSLPPSGYQAVDTEVEGDYSGASYLLAAGALGKRPVTVKGLRQDSLQGDAAILDILAQMGAGVSWSGEGVTISPASLQGIDIDMGNCPDLVPTVAILAARAKGATIVRNVAHLRIKESDRIAAPVAELAKIGCDAKATEDGLIVMPLLSGVAPSRGEVLFSSHGDHRIAMSLALLELGEDVTVALDDPGCVAKSYPEFWDDWAVIRPESRAGIRR